MSNSTPQGPGPEFGSRADGSPIDEAEAIDQAMDAESAELSKEGDDGVIDISVAEGPDISGGDDVA